MSPRLYKCKNCSVQLYSLKKFKSHISSHWPRRTKIKQENIEIPFTLTREPELLASANTVACTTSNMEMSSEDTTTLEQPLRKSKEELQLPVFICPQCNREFHHKGPYMRHFKSCKLHSSSLDGSNATVIDKSKLNKPMRVQRLRRNYKPASLAPSLEESFQCPVCQQKFFRIGNLLRHFKNSACSSNPSLSHLNVQTSFKKRISEVNNNVVTYPCPHCKKTFNYKSSMKHHMRMHSQLVDHFTCRICKKKFRHGYELESHYKTHVVKSPRTCQASREKFKRTWSLQLHEESHNGDDLRANATSGNAKDYRYSCHYCGKSFARLEQSQEHMKVHMLMSTHSCHTCGNEYTTRNSLYRHIQVAHLENPNQVMYDFDSSLYLEEEEFDEEEKLLGNAFEEQNGAEADPPLQGYNVTSSMPTSSRRLLRNEPDSPGSARLDENTLCHKVQRFISLLMDNVTLQELIEPGVPVATLLEKVIKYYGLTPVDCNKYPNGEGLRKNCRLLFAALLDDETVDELLIYFMKVASGRLS